MQQNYTLAFYNVENLFDTVDDPYVQDENYTPDSSRKWTEKRYKNKLGKLSKAISEIGKTETGKLPTLVGLAEVENETVIQDLINMVHLESVPYQSVHYDSLDERGIDCALIYNPEEFELINSQVIRPPQFFKNGIQDFTRDILYVQGKLNNEVQHIFVVHLPSKRDDDVNLPKRKEIAKMLRERIDQIFIQEETPHIVIMGDFNDGPDSETLQKCLQSDDNGETMEWHEFFNQMEILDNHETGTTMHDREWLFFDQILFSKAFFESEEGITLKQSDIFDPLFLQEWKRKYRGQPFRTFVGKKYLGGYSDHFPVYGIVGN